ncbi:HipA N-terminal domain-containing protein [Candidatus Poriferisodalis sp.]|uniref:HipA N-terminal domain-containing protein n=1 Tax=Candidatus Poriferisodalis sp. TaxID=3101277 RepID=UPI003B029531
MNHLPDLTVLMNGSVAAHLSSDSRGHLVLRYDSTYMDAPDAIPLSLAMPFTERPHGHRAVQRWTQSLLPDNPSVLSRWYDREDVQQRTPFGLLSTAIGLDCAGAVQFCPVGAEHRLAARSSGIQTLTSQTIRRELSAIVNDPDAWHSDDLEPYFSLAGFQSKIALHRVNDGWSDLMGAVRDADLVGKTF